MDFFEGQEIQLEITGMNHQGQGVAKPDGFTVFVDEAITGEIVRVKITQKKKTYAVGFTIEVLRCSTERALAFCPVFGKCGGCHLQHMTYRENLRFKETVVRDSIQRIGNLKAAQILPTIGMIDPFKYRNKAQFPYGKRGGRAISGLYYKKSHKIVEFLECPIQKEVNDKVKRVVDEFVAEYRIEPYNEETKGGYLRHVCVRTAHNIDEAMVVLVVNGKSFPRMDELIRSLTLSIPIIKSIYVNVNTANTNIVLGEENILVYGKDNIVDTLGDFKFEISPMSFYQVNPIQTEFLYSEALKYAELNGEETVFDLYSGIGTISIFFSKRAKKVYGIEVVKQAVNDANRNRVLNNIKNVEFLEGLVEKEVPKLLEKGVKADVVVLDPPRKGCDEKLLKVISKINPSKIVYISCNPSTLARDLAFLENEGFETLKVQPVDMFPWTRHIETCSLLTSNSC